MVTGCFFCFVHTYLTVFANLNCLQVAH